MAPKKVRNTRAKSTASTVATPEGPTPVPANTNRRRGRPPKNDNTEATADESAKHQNRKRAMTLTDDDELEQQQRKKAKVQAREPAPARLGRNNHPGKQPGVGPRAKKPSAEVKAEQEQKRQQLEAQIEKAKRAERALAEMDFDDEEQTAQRQKANMRHLSAFITKDLTTHESSGESFEEPSSGSESSESESSLDQVPLSKKLREKAIHKQPIQVNVEVHAGKLRGSGGKKTKAAEKVIMRPTFNKADLAPAKYKNSGFINPRKKAKKDQEKMDLRVGGLSDEDIEQDRPEFEENNENNMKHDGFSGDVEVSAGLQRDTTRRNTAVAAPVRVDKDKPSKPKGKAALDTKGGKGAKKDSEKVPTAGDKKKQRDDEQKGWTTHPRWRSTFLPTLNHALFVSQSPFLHFRLESSEFLPIIQQVFNVSFPDIQYMLRDGDFLLKEAATRMRTRKSLIGSDTLKAVKKIFESEDFAGQPVKIQAYVDWALRGDGPAHYSQPTPEDCVVDQNDPTYIQPAGFFESPLIISLAAEAFRKARKSALAPPISSENPPLGLYALILVAIERALGAFDGGTYNEKSLIEFSHINYHEGLRQWVEIMDSIVSANRWQLLLDGISTSAKEQTVAPIVPPKATQTISARRARIFVPPTPKKA